MACASPRKDSLFAETVADIGAFCPPPETVVVLCGDEKAGVQALDRTQPLLPLTFDKTEKRLHDYFQHGRLNQSLRKLGGRDGKVAGGSYQRCRSEEFLAFMKTVAAQCVDRDIHVVGTHLTAAARDWLAANPSLVSGLGPDGWLMQVEPGWRGFVSSVDQVEVQLPGTAWPMVLRNPQEFLVAAVVRGDD